MSTSTKKDETSSMLDDLKAQAAALAAKIKEATDAHLETLHTKLNEAHEVVRHLTAEIQKHSGKPAAPSPAKRGRKAKATTVKPAKATRKAKGKKGAMGEAIAAFLTSKGKAGAHVKDIAAEIGKPVPNVTSFFYSSGGKAKYKNLGKATFALKK